MMLKAAAALGLALLVGAVALTAAAQEGSTPVIGGDEAAVRAFIAQMAGRGGPFEADTVVYIELPEDMPFDLPLPEQTQGTGAVVQDLLEDRMLQILLASDQSARSVLDFYTEAFTVSGWRLIENPSSSGFVSAPLAAANFCLNDDEWFINMMITDRKDGGADALLYAQGPAWGMSCSDDTDRFFSGLHALLPALTPPDSVRMSAGSGGSAGGGPLSRRARSTETTLISSGPEAAAILAHDNSQLEAAGWSLADTAADARVGWSRWTFTSAQDDAPWSGTLVVIRSPLAEDEYYAQLRIEEGR